MNGKEFIEKVRKSIEADRGRRIWEDTVTGVSLASELIFTRSSHFVMEIIQNAEDAGMGQQNGEMEIRISRKRVLITHNARPFSKEDVNALCGLRTTKKPELGAIGYLGIGFKSVFKVTDSPTIFSGDFQFKFDKSEWKNPEEVPWQIIPQPVDSPPEPIDPNKTTFYLQFRNERAYEETNNEFKNLGLHLYLFLKWLKKITIVDEESDKTITLENLGEENRIVTLARSGEKERYLMLRRSGKIPSHIADDEITRSAKRSKVKQREIIVAFRVDKDNNLVPLTAAEAYGGIYSFLPLGEERSGAKFLIQADFIVVPGRESINYEAAWNHWLIEEVTKCVKETIELFKQNPIWREQYLSLFEFTTYSGQPSFEKLFYPKLYQPLERYLKESKCIPTCQGDFVKSDDAVIISKESKGIIDLLSNEDLKKIFPEKREPRMVKPETALGPLENKVSSLDMFSLARHKNFLQEKAKKPDAVEWFRKLYLKIYEFAKPYSSPSYVRGKYLYPMCVLTENLEILKSDEVYFRSLPQEVIELSKKFPEVAKVLSSFQFLHPELEKDDLSNFFDTYSGVRKLDYSKICEETFLPKIRTEQASPREGDLITYTRLVRKGPYIYGNIWVLTESGKVRPSNEVFLSAEYSPAQNWEKNKKYLAGVEFLSINYIEDIQKPEDINQWRNFFTGVGVKEEGNKPHVETFGVEFCKEMLSSEAAEERLGYYFVKSKFKDKQKENLGYDFEAETVTGEEKYLEIKSRVHAENIDLEPNETQRADRYKDDYLLCIIDGIPETPQLYVVPDPVKHGQKERVTIPLSAWRGFKLQTQIDLE